MRWTFSVLLVCLRIGPSSLAQARALRNSGDEALRAPHRREEIFVPLGVDENGSVEGLLIEDLEAEKGPLVIEEIVDSEGNIRDVIIERASDLSVENAAKRQRRNRRFGAPNTDSSEATKETPPRAQTTETRKAKSNDRSLLPLIVLLVTVAFSIGFVLSICLADALPLPFSGWSSRKKQIGLNKKLSLRPQPWKDDKDLYSPVKSPTRSPTRRTVKKASAVTGQQASPPN